MNGNNYREQQHSACIVVFPHLITSFTKLERVCAAKRATTLQEFEGPNKFLYRWQTVLGMSLGDTKVCTSVFSLFYQTDQASAPLP